jgi:hypothetical protein
MPRADAGLHGEAVEEAGTRAPAARPAVMKFLDGRRSDRLR